jgi:hypothetical protein
MIYDWYRKNISFPHQQLLPVSILPMQPVIKTKQDTVTVHCLPAAVEAKGRGG